MDGVKLADRTDLIEESVTIALNAKAKKLARGGRKIYNFTAGELDTETPVYIQEYVNKKLSLNKYTPTAGLPELKQLIADHNENLYGLSWIKSENIVVTSGAKPAIYVALLSLINPGDEVIVPIPAWVSYIDLIKLVGGVPVTVELKPNFDLDSKAVKRAITSKTKLVILTSPHNPTGSIFSKKELTDLTNTINEKNIFVMADEIYNKLVFDIEYFPVPNAGFKKLVIINGFSKSQALTGWRIGYLIAPKRVAEAATAMLSHINGNAPLISQYAGIAAMQRNDKPPAANLEHIESNLKIAYELLKDISDIETNNPGGAFYIYLDLRRITNNSLVWCEKLIENYGVALVPGEAFMTPGFARLTYSGNTETLVKGIKQIAKSLRSENA